MEIRAFCETHAWGRSEAYAYLVFSTSVDPNRMLRSWKIQWGGLTTTLVIAS